MVFITNMNLCSHDNLEEKREIVGDFLNLVPAFFSTVFH